MWDNGFSLLLLFYSLQAFAKSDVLVQWGPQCVGNWEVERGPQRDGEIFVSSLISRHQKLTNSTRLLCPIESIIYDCFRHESDEGRTRALKLRARKFVLSKDPGNCHYLSSYDFLSAHNGKTIIFLGDSVGLQMFQSVVCELLVAARATFVITHDNHAERCIVPNGCSTVSTADVYFRSSRTRLIFHTLYWGLYRREVVTFFRKLQPTTGANNLMFVVLFGIHYNEYPGKPIQFHDSADFRQHLGDFRQDVETQIAGSIVFLLQVPPQHFSGSNQNGYWCGFESKDVCGPLRNLTKAIQEDWRNRYIDNLKLPQNLHVVRIADALYTQWDAHFSEYDCTHYCKQSGIWDFIRLQLFNSMAFLNTANDSQQFSSHRG